MTGTILVAGATGELGGKITRKLVKNGASVRALARPTSAPEKLVALEKSGAEVIVLDDWNLQSLTAACVRVSCVVSVLAGLREVVVDAQKLLLDAALAAGVTRFIPSDYSLDFTKFSQGENRNLDWRREFHTYLDAAPIAATSIFNGAFMELLTGDMPMIMFKPKLVLYWGDSGHKLAFTTMDDTAAYTARASMEPVTPRYLRIAGDQVSPRDIRRIVNEATAHKFRLICTGPRSLLGLIIKVTRKFAPGEKELYPAWQGMQYMHNMTDRRASLKVTDNDRYPNLQWTSVEDLLTEYTAQN